MNWRALEITDKQRRYISEICDVLKIKFSGKTRGEASAFIGENKEDFDSAVEEMNEALGINEWAIVHGY